HLDLRGFDVLLLLASPGESLTGDALLNYQIADRAGLPMKVIGADLNSEELKGYLTQAEWIVDGLLGTGAVGDPRPPFDGFIEAINFAKDAGAHVFALDLPSGWDCDTGEPGKPCVRADHTVTFAVMKPGFLKPQAVQFAGHVEVVDIGVPRRLIMQVAEEYAREVSRLR
ncbi:NAD(P)H-hydrate epimerase, partial [Thermogutta sp.]